MGKGNGDGLTCDRTGYRLLDHPRNHHGEAYAHSHHGDGSCFRRRIRRLARAMPIVAVLKFEDEAKYTEAEQTVNPLVAFDKNWLTPLLPLIIGYSFIEIDEGRPGFCF